MAPRTRSSGAPAEHKQQDQQHPQAAPETPRNNAKRSLDDDMPDSEHEAKRPQTAPPKTSYSAQYTASATGTRLFERGTSFVALNRARRQQQQQQQRLGVTPRAQRLGRGYPSSATPLEPARATVDEEDKEDEGPPTTPIQPEPRQSTVSWLMGIPSRLFSPSKASTPPAQSSSSSRQPGQSSEQNARDDDRLFGRPVGSQSVPPKRSIPPLTPIEKARQDLRIKRRILQRKKEAGKTTARGIELLERKFEAEEREIDAREREAFSPEQVEGSKKRKLSSNTFALIYSDDEDSVNENGNSGSNTNNKDNHGDVSENSSSSSSSSSNNSNKDLSGDNDIRTSPPAANEDTAPAATPKQSRPKTPLKSALKSGQAGTAIKKLRINETPTRVKKLYGHYGPAGEYTGSTFADKSRNSFSSVEEDFPRTGSSDDSSVPSDAQAVRHKVLSPTTKFHTHVNSMPASAAEKSAEEMPNPFRSIKKGKPFVQPNSFRVPYLDEPSDDEAEDDDQPQRQQDATAAPSDTARASTVVQPISPDLASASATPATPRMSHAELPEIQASTQLSGRAQDEPARNKESEEAALKKLREAAQKYKPKTSSRLSTVEEKTQSPTTPPSATTTSSSSSSNSNEAAAPQQKPGQGPYPLPYTWTRPPKGSYSTTAPDYEPWILDDTHVGTDGMTDKQRRAARDAAADAWVAENVHWPQPPSYVDAGLCSNYIDGLMKTEVCPEGQERTDKIMGEQFEDILKWAYEEKAKGNRCALTWNNGREELVW